ncbi:MULTISPECIES: hypothetical protein [unclassified Psychrobacter]|uniref:hypothetical protein n=1 Tax=unclassified Psychrobacter TaxID=196806 RepID=UPI0025FA020E|nr:MULTISPECIES: hypothetical protein [unclassified Psychrobacter]
MSKVKLRLITWTALLLTLFIGAISYGCTANEGVSSSSITSTKNSDQTISLSKGDADSMNNRTESNDTQSSKIATEADMDNGLPTNNNPIAQLGSINNDQDGLRPEIRRILHAKFSNETELKAALRGASILQDYLDQPNQDAVAMIKRYDCSVLPLTQADQNLIQSLTFDTDTRKNKIKNGLKGYQPAVSIEIQIDNQGNAISPCSNMD